MRNLKPSLVQLLMRFWGGISVSPTEHRRTFKLSDLTFSILLCTLTQY